MIGQLFTALLAAGLLRMVGRSRGPLLLVALVDVVGVVVLAVT